jgi:hypothetical protein
VQAILPSGSNARGNNAFYPSSAAPAPLAIDDEDEDEDEAQAEAEPPQVTAEPLVAAAFPDINFAVPHLPLASPSTMASSSVSGKRTRDNALLDVEESSFASDVPSQTHSEPLSPNLASATLVSTRPAPKKIRSARITSGSGSSLMTSAVRAAKVTPATAVIGMQGSINRIGDILEKIGTGPAATSTSSASPTASSTVSSIRPSTTDRAIHVLCTEDADLPVDQIAALMMIFSDVSNERAMEMYIGSTHLPVEARRAYIKGLIATHTSKQM